MWTFQFSLIEVMVRKFVAPLFIFFSSKYQESERDRVFFIFLSLQGQKNISNVITSLKVKNDPRSEFSNLSNWKEEA